ncbi:LacI family DNA-binding transcriptional regulator [Sphingomonas parva]|uniref:LacI family DNA-binding transcriptional regulator n=1 Tax=Sphingomonas parva TaxID=2555898 RepID=A0A4Y8ZUJ4_9SPHN|nr:LacI family DNA-binding transcriptional regulator [Sphingomonas parva]TFI58982.1 LacI family DNA-binding transcriptional regulator [Sphingomonas parva]
MNKPTRRSRGTVTIEDVARAAGVSAMTVSRVINGGKNVRESTRASVLEAVNRLNYTPNTAARNLAAGEATHIGLLYANPSAAYLSLFLIGALEAARRAGCHLVIESCESEDGGEQAELIRRFVTSDVEGVILPPPLSESQPIMAELRQMGIPFVTVAMGVPDHDNPNIKIDDFTAAAEITRHLLSLGHRRLGMIKGHPNHIASHDRERGFLAALAEYGVAAEEATIEQGYFTYRSGLTAAERLLARAEPPTAIFAANDDMAAATISVAHRRGLTVPGDLSVVGFDDTSLATSVWPELTTVRQPISSMAASALELLLVDIRARRGGGRSEVNEKVLEHELVLRESAGPPSVSWQSRGRLQAPAASAGQRA